MLTKIERLEELEALANDYGQWPEGSRTQKLAAAAIELVGEVRRLREDRDRADEALGLAVNLLVENEVERNRLRAEVETLKRATAPTVTRLAP